jgi:hypothetical protein
LVVLVCLSDIYGRRRRNSSQQRKVRMTMKRFATLVGGLVGVWLLGPMVREAAAVDLTGTWKGATAKCHGLVIIGNQTQLAASTPSKITIKISPNAPGLNVCVDLDRTDLNDDLNGAHRYRGTFFPKAANSNTSHGTLTATGTAISSGNLSGAVGGFTSSFDKIELVLKLKGSLISGDGSSALQCTFKNLIRTSTTDPGTACP